MSKPFTATEQRIWDMLQDGKPHTRIELKTLIDPDNPELCNSLGNHMSRIRSKMPTGLELIVRQTEPRRSQYQLLRKLWSANDGRS